MANYSESSRKKLNTCHSALRRLFEAVLEDGFDHKILCGHRSEEEQQKAFENGYSLIQFPGSSHNTYPSKAVDALPYPIDWEDIARISHFAGYVKAKSRDMGIMLRWGGDWDGDFNLSDQSFYDLAHFEIYS